MLSTTGLFTVLLSLAQNPVQIAFDTLAPGQTAVIPAGTYGRAVCDRSTGDGGSASGGYVTLRAERPGAVTLTAATDGVLYIDCDYVRIVGFRIVGPGAVGGTLVYGVAPSHHVELLENEITGSVCQGIYTDEGTADFLIARNRIHHNGTAACDRQAHGIYVEGDRHVVASNVIHDHPRGFGIQHYDYGRDVRIINNTITRSGHGGIVVGGAGAGPSGSRVAGAVVVGNIVTFNGTWGVDRDGTAPTSCAIHHNLAFGNGSGAYDSGWPAGCLGNNAAADPLYADEGARDLRVRAGSPAVDAGDPSMFYPVAFDGAARPLGAGPDIGAYELGGVVPPPDTTPAPPPDTTPPAPPPPPAQCGPVSDLRIDDPLIKNARFRWDAALGAMMYRVYRDGALYATTTGLTRSVSLAWGTRLVEVEAACGATASPRVGLRLRARWELVP